MRIKFIKHEDYQCDCIGNEYQIGELKAEGHTIVAGYRIAANGILKPFVEDITEYRTEIVDGEKVQVEVVPVEGEGSPVEYDIPTIDDLKADILAFMDKNKIPYNSGDIKQDLIDKIHIYYGLPM